MQLGSVIQTPVPPTANVKHPGTSRDKNLPRPVAVGDVLNRRDITPRVCFAQAADKQTGRIDLYPHVAEHQGPVFPVDVELRLITYKTHFRPPSARQRTSPPRQPSIPPPGAPRRPNSTSTARNRTPRTPPEGRNRRPLDPDQGAPRQQRRPPGQVNTQYRPEPPPRRVNPQPDRRSTRPPSINRRKRPPTSTWREEPPAPPPSVEHPTIPPTAWTPTHTPPPSNTPKKRNLEARPGRRTPESAPTRPNPPRIEHPAGPGQVNTEYQLGTLPASSTPRPHPRRTASPQNAAPPPTNDLDQAGRVNPQPGPPEYPARPHRYSQNAHHRRDPTVNPARRYTTMAAAAAGILAALLALPAGTQNSPAVPDLDPANCGGNYAVIPASARGSDITAAECRTLVSIRNHWTRQGLPPNSLLLNWGSGRWNDWHGIGARRFGDPYRVTVIDLIGDRVGLTGPIPPELAQLTHLETLWLYRNELTGPIPAELAQLTNLTSLNLGGNELTGPIPAELAQLTNLISLYLYGNELTGPIPAELGQLTNLETLWLYGNELTGPIPAELARLTNLTRLYLGDGLTGPIPASLTRQLTYQITELQCPPPVHRQVLRRRQQRPRVQHRDHRRLGNNPGMRPQKLAPLLPQRYHHPPADGRVPAPGGNTPNRNRTRHSRPVSSQRC